MISIGVDPKISGFAFPYFYAVEKRNEPYYVACARHRSGPAVSTVGPDAYELLPARNYTSIEEILVSLGNLSVGAKLSFGIQRPN